ncbi:MAG: outer membrane beta-barrel protein, partial [Chitinophagaceae bacterium]
LQSLKQGKYIISASYVGFATVWKAFETNEMGAANLGKIELTNINQLTDVTVVGKRPPVTINNDTLEFNTENFKTAPNAVVEDLLKRLPGVVIDADGTVRVNGQIVRRVLVDGKEFFTGDPKIATKNLDASAVDKVQVYDRKSDRAQFTGIDDGSAEKAINLKLKSDRKNAVFGRVTAGAGNNERYDGQTNINKFNGDKQMSFIGMGNNTNKQGFSISDVMNFTGELGRGMRNGGGVNIRVTNGNNDNGLPISGLGQNQQGVATTFAGGVNYNNTFKKKTDLNTNALFSNIDLNTDRITNRQLFLPDNTTNFSNDTSFSNRRNLQQRVNFIVDHKIDSFTSIRFTPQLTFQQNKSSRLNQYQTANNKGIVLNSGFSNNQSNATALNFTGTALLRKRFKKKGRTISATVNHSYNESESDGDLYSLNRFYNSLNGSYKDSILNQENTRASFTRNLGVIVTYTEPMGKKSLLELSGYHNLNSSESNRSTFDYNNISKRYDIVNSNLTNNFSSTYNYSGGTIGFRTNQGKLSYTFNASAQSAILKSINNSTGSIIQNTFTDVLPSANITYRPKQSSSINFSYNTSTQQPSAIQLQPIADNSNPLNIVYGNPKLNRSYQQSFSLNYFSANMYKQRNLFAFVAANFTNNDIVYADSIFANGARSTRPINVNGNYFIFGNINYGFAIKKLKSRIDAGINMNLFRNASFVNGAKNIIRNNSFGPNINYTFTLENKLDVILNSRVNFNTAKNALQPQLSNSFVQQVYGLELTQYLPKGFVFNSNFNYTINTGRSDGFNTNIPFWNSSIAKSFLKNKRAEIKFTVFDILNKNIGINRVANQNFIEDVQYNVLQRYFLLSFTFSLNKSTSTNSGPRVMVRTFGN